MADRISILFAAANPTTTAQVAAGEDLRALDLALRRARTFSRFELIFAPIVRLSDIERCLSAHHPTIVHFRADEGAEEALSFEGAPEVTGEALAELFRTRGGSVRCATLSGCFHPKQAEGLRKHVDIVVGLRAPPDARLSFSKAFYQALADGHPAEIAFERAVSATGPHAPVTHAPALLLREGVNGQRLSL